MIVQIKKLLEVLPLLIVITGLFGTVFLIGQQNLRQSANDPQIQMVEDLSISLNSGKTLESLVAQNKVDIATSLATFVTVFDESGRPVWSNAALGGKTPGLPSGVFEASKTKQDRVTWQPIAGVRCAIVVTKYNGGFVMAGRSLREVEKREKTLAMQVGIAWLMTIVAMFVAKELTKKKK